MLFVHVVFGEVTIETLPKAIGRKLETNPGFFVDFSEPLRRRQLSQGLVEAMVRVGAEEFVGLENCVMESQAAIEERDVLIRIRRVSGDDIIISWKNKTSN